MRILASLTPRRLAAHVTVAVVVGTATAAGVALATSNGGSPGSAPAATGASAPSPVEGAARTALDRLVAAGTIDQAQADAVMQQVDAGGVDGDALVAGGTVNQQQMQAVQAALVQVKLAAAAAAHAGGAGSK